MRIQPGIYRHYKGPEYRVFGVARHSETEEQVVVYQALYGEYGLWIRPLSMFLESVDVDGKGSRALLWSRPRTTCSVEGPVTTSRVRLAARRGVALMLRRVVQLPKKERAASCSSSFLARAPSLQSTG